MEGEAEHTVAHLQHANRKNSESAILAGDAGQGAGIWLHPYLES